MKKLGILLSFLFISTFSFAQIYVNGEKADRKIGHYLMIYIEANFKQDVDIRVDYGQAKKFAKRYYLTNRKGDKLKFNSFVHAMNYFHEQGWKLFDQYENTESLTKNGNNTTVSYLMVRNKEIKYEEHKGMIPVKDTKEN